jgi:hypothetical protein
MKDIWSIPPSMLIIWRWHSMKQKIVTLGSRVVEV